MRTFPFHYTAFKFVQKSETGKLSRTTTVKYVCTMSIIVCGLHASVRIGIGEFLLGSCGDHCGVECVGRNEQLSSRGSTEISKWDMLCVHCVCVGV